MQFDSLFISFEGIDGAGKTSQIKLLESYFLTNYPQINVVTTYEPGGSPIGKTLRQAILHGSDISKKTELLLYLAERAEHVDKIISPALNKSNTIVICDRYIDSTTAYQAGGRGFLDDEIEYLNGFASSKLFPDLTFILDLSVEESKKRISKKNPDRLERLDDVFFDAVRKKYLSIKDKRVTVLNAMDDKQSIHQKIVEVINERMG